MDSFYTPLTDREIKQLQWSVLLEEMNQFANTVRAEDFACLPHPPAGKTQFLHRHKPIKFKGGRPPKDYTALEDFLDFKAALQALNFDEAIPLYFSLKRLLNR